SHGRLGLRRPLCRDDRSRRIPGVASLFDTWVSRFCRGAGSTGCDLGLQSGLGGCSIACNQLGEPALTRKAFGMRTCGPCTKAVGRLTSNITPVATVKICYRSKLTKG